MSDNDEGIVGDLHEPLRSVFGEAGPSTIFSKPEKLGDSIVITASAWERAGGFGFGSGYGSDEEESGGGGGGGGGGTSQGRPVAIIRATASDIQVTPVIDFTKIGVTVLLALAGWVGLRRRAG